MRSYSNVGLICVKDKLNIEYVLCKLEYTLYKDERFKYVFTPYYDVIDLLDTDIFQGIPGLNLDLKRKEYIRENILPTFISERVPNKNRVDYYELLDEVGLDFMNPIEYLIRTDYKYSGDDMYMIRYQNREPIDIESIVGRNNSFGITKLILDNISHGNTVVLNNEIINNKEVYNTLLFLYKKSFNEIKEKQRIGIEEAKINGNYVGRKPIKVDEEYLMEECNLYNNGKITLKEALENLQMSKATFYRKKKKYE